ncbi:MAG: hypothetical protein R3Y56_02140 [Akkermansia sp.]
MIKPTIQFAILSTLALSMPHLHAATEAETAGAQAALTQTKLPPTEAHIRSGIILLNDLNQCLAGIDSQEKANNAVAKVLEIQMKLTQWGQGFNALPTENADIIAQYDKYYLPIIEQINAALMVQSQRLSAAAYYQSSSLGAALINLVDALK